MSNIVTGGPQRSHVPTYIRSRKLKHHLSFPKSGGSTISRAHKVYPEKRNNPFVERRIRIE
jgi:hypothetical protein